MKESLIEKLTRLYWKYFLTVKYTFWPQQLRFRFWLHQKTAILIERFNNTICVWRGHVPGEIIQAQFEESKASFFLKECERCGVVESLYARPEGYSCERGQLVEDVQYDGYMIPGATSPAGVPRLKFHYLHSYAAWLGFGFCFEWKSRTITLRIGKVMVEYAPMFVTCTAAAAAGK